VAEINSWIYHYCYWMSVCGVHVALNSVHL